MDCSSLGSSVHGIISARILEWIAIFSSGELPNPEIKTSFLHLHHCQMDSLPLSHLGSLFCFIFKLSCSVLSDSMRPHGLQHARPPCPSPTPGVYSNSCPSSQWCHPTISSSVILFSSHLQSFPASGSFPLSQFFTSGGQRIGGSASTSVPSMSIQDWSPLGWTGWISFQSKGLSSLLQHHSLKASILRQSAFFIVQLSHPYMTTGKP